MRSIDSPRPGRTTHRIAIVLVGLFVLTLAVARVSGPPGAGVSSPERPAALVSWIDATSCPRVLVQRVGPEGFLDEPLEVWRAPCHIEGVYHLVRQFHASPDGRVLAFFSRQSDFGIPRHLDRLVVLTLDRSGEVVSRSEKELSSEFVIDEEQDQIQIGAATNGVR